ncbi:HAD-IIB family hydrolase [Parahaliea mediterranea]|uniref:HAD-IIB family hydrolase n=1 Tax=Parahaliea mediterranea TaxID=651086 RepID=A0A939DBJ6_9GAMM|nr:HAD-IIB family hydrolase [Parahaliea mediterranea]MBN7795140.1 HAD-IIB family hydrolase [Parahaliea mediterranea]
MPGDDRQRLVFTDLDGTLLDHHSYSYADAMPRLRALDRMAIPVIPATSKTRAEVEQLRRELGNRHPFIVENGAAVFIPEDYFASRPDGTRVSGGYWIRELAPPRARWLELLSALEGDYGGEFQHFFRLGTPGIMQLTGLPEARARQANEREYSEPVHWLGRESRKQRFVAALEAAGATVLRGGRFLSVSGDSDKGRALQWLRACYREREPGLPVDDLAAGDGDNDRAMLEAAGTALLVRSPVHDFPQLRRGSRVIRSRATGPAGWAEGVATWLRGDTGN